MAMHVPQSGFRNMLKDGVKVSESNIASCTNKLKFNLLFLFQYFSGIEEAVIRNIQACKEFTNTIKTCYGPNGMNKLVINHIDKLFLTSDAGTIVRELEVSLNSPISASVPDR
jgi:T-complex protein 1 subunit theta